ncbi:MAG: transposase, partial [Lachnospiraceae bacterium]|nr:transposase [Lachnospiraceae bacterium]
MEKKILKDYGLDQVIVCTDAGLSSKNNRKFNDRTINGERLRSFITTQSVKQLPEYLKDFALDPEGWHLSGDSRSYNINKLDESEY